jgi:hypothetical protein
VYFRHTLEHARMAARTSCPDDVKPDVRIQLIELQTNVQAVIGFLNGEKPVDPKVLRTWKLTPRGGLVELGEDGKPLEKSE